jgi:site-specific recombinase XerD
MKTAHSFSIDFLIRKCKSNEQEAIIYVRVTVNEERREISLKEKIEPGNWHPSHNVVLGKSSDIKKLNDHIKNVEMTLRQHYRTLVAAGSEISAEIIKQCYLGVQVRKKEHTLIELMDFYKKAWEGKLAEGNFKNYRTTIDYITNFLILNHGGDINLSKIDGEFVTLLEMYIRNNPIQKCRPCNGNGVGKNIQRFKRIINWGFQDLKWLSMNSVENYSCPIKKSKRKKLTTEMLVMLENKSFADSGLAYVKELFLFSCYTGLAYVDVMKLDNSHFEWDTDETVWCKIYRTKSDEFCPVPLLPSATSILAKYRSNSRLEETKIFPQISNQEVNKALKFIGEVCDISIPLTFHVARHTFAKTVALKNGVPLESVQMMLGHAKITTTQIYADVDEEKIIDDMSTVEEKLNKKRNIVLQKHGERLIQQ